MKKVDAIIMGQGLAGTCMAFELLSRGASFLIFDPYQHLHGLPANASRSAAGLFNPITGRKMLKTWMADELFTGLPAFYQRLEKILQASFFHSIPIYRPFTSYEDQNDWVGADLEQEYTDYIDVVRTQSAAFENINDPFGGLLLKNSGYVDLSKLLDLAGNWFRQKGLLIESKFEESKIQFFDNRISYPHLQSTFEARFLINCTGTGYKDSLFWNELRFKPVKGEWLKLELSLQQNEVINRGVFMIPREGSFRVGATYDHQELDHETTARGRDQILDRMGKIYTGEYRILDQVAGIRPATFDRKPFVGRHQKHDQLLMLNGLGAKGVTLAPYFAKQLADLIFLNRPVQKEVDVVR